MNLTKTAGVLLAVLLVATAGVAALPGNAPADSQAGQADDTYDDSNASDAPADAGPGMNDSETGENASNADDRQGPPTDMPAQVPDHVSQIHELVHQYLDGDIDNLGAQISDLMGGGEAAEEGEDADEAEEDDSDDSEMDEEDSDEADEDSEDDADNEEMDDEADEDSEEGDEMSDDATATPA
mgnify:CR=1 FL=1